MKRILILTSLILGSFSLAAQASEVVIKEIKGLVLVNSGQAFETAAPNQVLKPGHQIYVLDRSAVVIAQQDGCHVNIRQNALITLTETPLCDIQASSVKFMGTRYAAAIGVVSGSGSDAAAPAGSGALGGIVIEEEPVEIAQTDIETPVPEEGGIEGLATKLAVPATVLGAIGFSALVGGAGEPGDDDKEVSPS